MAGKSRLSDRQWEDILRRHLQGETLKALAKEYGMTPQGLAVRVSGMSQQVKKVAKQIVEAEEGLHLLPITAQLQTVAFANELRAISMHLAGAAKHGSMTAHRLAQAANAQVERIDESVGIFEPSYKVNAVTKRAIEVNNDALRTIAAMTEGANRAAHIGLNLLSANKEQVREANNNIIDITPSLVPDDPVEASRAYQRLLGGSS